MYKQYVPNRSRPHRNYSRKKMLETVSSFYSNQEQIVKKLCYTNQKKADKSRSSRLKNRNYSKTKPNGSVHQKIPKIPVRQLRMLAFQKVPHADLEKVVNQTYDPKKVYQNSMVSLKRNIPAETPSKGGFTSNNVKLGQLRIRKIEIQKEILQNGMKLHNLCKNIMTQEAQIGLKSEKSAVNLTDSGPECAICHLEIEPNELTSRMPRPKSTKGFRKKLPNCVEQELDQAKKNIKILKKSIMNTRFKIEKQKVKAGPMKGLNKLILEANRVLEMADSSAKNQDLGPLNIQIKGEEASEIDFTAPCKQYFQNNNCEWEPQLEIGILEDCGSDRSFEQPKKLKRLKSTQIFNHKWFDLSISEH
ncbi:unnamed protein product [Moneuplotes crassus]|uniref:Uncharacterized protein n=1 Tax=Euplotes crassus TaxID=5936 RepID=A0AAD1XG02_EUPCR|nr:unnamed protein product [Moneuplotes crassus]